MFRSLPAAVLVSIAITQLAIFTTTIYLHRALAHHAVTLSPGVAGLCRVVTWIGTGIRPRQWVAVHRKHHAHTDTEGDPHSPVLLGYARVQFANVVLYRLAITRQTVARHARDLPADRWDRALFDHALLGLGIGVAGLCVLFGPWLGLAAGALHAASYLLLSAAVNAIGHTWGRRPYANLATNVQWLAWLTAGEGLHNNHHAAPTSARLSLAPGQIDPGWWVISALRRLGWAEVRHAEPRIRQAPPLAA